MMYFLFQQVDSWPYINFCSKAKYGLVRENVRHSLVLEDVIAVLSYPSLTMKGSRLFYIFDGLYCLLVRERALITYFSL